MGQVPKKVQLSDNKATTETKNLFQNLNKLKEKGFMFGHQDDLAYGVNWKYEAGRSDVKMSPEIILPFTAGIWEVLKIILKTILMAFHLKK